MTREASDEYHSERARRHSNKIRYEKPVMATLQRRQQLSPQLAEIVTQLGQASRRAEALFEGLNIDQMRQPPGPDQWSVAECLAHLSLTTETYLPALDAAYEKAREDGLFGEGPFGMDIMGRMLRWFLEPPPKFRFKTTAEFQPLKAEPVGGVLPTFLRLQASLLASIQQANGLALDKIKITSPFDRRVRYNLLSCFKILCAHQRRHLRQAEQVKKSILNRAGVTAGQIS